MITYPTLEDCAKIATATGGNPSDAFGPRLIDHIIWDSADGTITYHSLTPESWVETDATTHVIAKLGADTMTAQEILDACHGYAANYLQA